jgi:hypothetical protein
MQMHDHSTAGKIVSNGSNMLETVKDLIHEGNVRRVIIRQYGRPIAEFPLTLGVVGAAQAAALAGIAAVFGVVADCTIEIEREPVGNGTTSSGMASNYHG